jgi:hypothetical protein
MQLRANTLLNVTDMQNMQNNMHYMHNMQTRTQTCVSLIHDKTRNSQSILLRYMSGCSWESNPTSPSAGEQHGCRRVPLNTVHTAVQTGPSIRGCSRHDGSRDCRGGPRAQPSLVQSIPVTFTPLEVQLGHWMIARKPALGVGDRTITRTGHVFPYT